MHPIRTVATVVSFEVDLNQYKSHFIVMQCSVNYMTNVSVCNTVTAVTGILLMVIIIGSVRLDYEYEIEYEYVF